MTSSLPLPRTSENVISNNSRLEPPPVARQMITVTRQTISSSSSKGPVQFPDDSLRKTRRYLQIVGNMRDLDAIASVWNGQSHRHVPAAAADRGDHYAISLTHVDLCCIQTSYVPHQPPPDSRKITTTPWMDISPSVPWVRTTGILWINFNTARFAPQSRGRIWTLHCMIFFLCFFGLEEGCFCSELLR